jgi:RecA-family ATPase
MTAAELLQANGISVPSMAPGRYYVTCPQCSAKRSRAHQKAPCLGVTVDADGACWGCSHCGWTGPEKAPGAGNGRGRDASKNLFVATYDYTDEDGALLFQVCRTADKNFPQRRPDGNGGWIWSTKDVRRPLFRLPELNEAIANERTILIVEGEKDVNNLCRLGLSATCSPGGAAKLNQKPKWRIEHSEALRGADIVIIPDNDEAGHAHAKATARMSLGVAARVRILDLARHWPDMPPGGDISDWLAAGHTREELDVLIVERAVDYQNGSGSDQAHKHDGQPNAGKARTNDTNEQPAPEPLPFVDMSNWDNEPVPDQEWTVFNRIPRRECVLFSGEGAAGKSTEQLHLSAAHVLARDWLGTMPEPGPAIFVDAEDSITVLHRRLAAVTRHYGVKFNDLIKGGLHLMSFAGRDAVLATLSRGGKIEPTPLYRQMLEAAGDIKPITMGIASSANVYAGSEIDRAQVQQFISLLTRLAIVANGSVVLISHPSLTGINSDTGVSGTTQWHNAVRARFYLKGIKPDAGELADTDLRELVFKKNNYGPISESIVLRYQDGLFLPVAGVSSLDKVAREATAEQVFLMLLSRFTAANRSVSDKPSITYAPALFAQEDEAKKAGLNSKALAAAMLRLFKAGTIWNEPQGRPSRKSYRIALKA